MVKVSGFGSTLNHTMLTTGTLHKPGNGVFLHSCSTHCGFLGWDWSNTKIRGLSMQQAVTKWWTSSNSNADEHVYLPCERIESGDYICNHSCQNGAELTYDSFASNLVQNA